ncbi:hypothetical protein CAPTEDRAFT_196930 [Capitella teleta]|uniref:Fucolectin tachylectin-4 pentraxin-1 domain-containing protein n=1 Tax=Capitella teleta TaxID=283909 RepID=R7V1H5_CAPTE|nr:hypothetical protein CAPTEDRAFT_196930 [Capitella teleta]|eukprot:ELU09541.1 hypothetical protein CAPTEDRAFT_196930 [Capitella teleta]
MKEFVLVLAVVGRVITSCRASCETGSFGEGCGFPCRCNNGQCDPETGSCADSRCLLGSPRPPNDPDLYNWRGSACQIGNVAYGKHTDQIGAWKGMKSNRGVDGHLDTQLTTRHNPVSEYCAHPEAERNQKAWFYVDLGWMHQIYNVTTYNTFDVHGSERMQEFAIGVGNTSVVSDHRQCGYHGDIVASGGSVTLDCPEVGRFVSFSRRRGKEPEFATICEFVVIGRPFTRRACEEGSFGVNCTGHCTGCKDHKCSAVDGRCSDGCQLWFRGEFCTEERDPTLRGLSPSANHINGSTIVIEWTQDQEIPAGLSQYYGYTLTYTDESGDVIFGPSVAHNPQIETQSQIVSDLLPCFEYHFYIQPYRLVDDVRKYDLEARAIALMESKARKWKLIAELVACISGAIIVVLDVTSGRWIDTYTHKTADSIEESQRLETLEFPDEQISEENSIPQ